MILWYMLAILFKCEILLTKKKTTETRFQKSSSNGKESCRNPVGVSGRQKDKNKEEYQRKERDRKNRNYVTFDKLSERDREERNRKNRANLKEFYVRKRAERARPINEVSNTRGYETAESVAIPDQRPSTSGGDQERGRLLVRMDFRDVNAGKRKAALKRWKRDRSAASSRIRILEQEREKLKTKLKSTQRSLQRLRNGSGSNANPNVELTLSKQTEQDMNDANLNNEQREKLRRSLLLGNVISSEIKQTKKNTPRHKIKALHNIVTGLIQRFINCFLINVEISLRNISIVSLVF